MKQLKEIEENLVYLPPKEASIARDLFKNRDFDALYKLVDDTTIKIMLERKKERKHQNFDIEYAMSDIEKIYNLLSLIDSYNQYL